MKARNEINPPPSWRRELRPREAVGCSQAYIYKLMKDGRLHNRALVTQGKRGIRLIDRSDVESFLGRPVA
jgi:hypothetical protein